MSNPYLDRLAYATPPKEVSPEQNGQAEKPEKKPKPKKSQATLMIEWTEELPVELFRAAGDDSAGYIRVPVDDHVETHKLKSNAFREWLRRLYWTHTKAAPSAQALADAIGVLTGHALYDAPELPVHRRIAGEDNSIWVDLCNRDWEAVEITTSGWRIVNNPDVQFVRRRGMLALPTPMQGGNLDDLRSLLNIKSDDDWVLILGWLVASYRPEGPYPILGLNGEQGAAKSTTSRMLRAMVDPNTAPLRSEPKDPRDLMIAANNAWMLAFDNLSYIGASLSDALCRVSTGGGFATRELYSDDEETLFDSMRPTLINGITELSTRPDLLDRTISLTLPTIPEDKRRTESSLRKEFDRLQPGILGALLDAVSLALRNQSSVRLERLPRMADFATWAVAAEPAFGLADVDFLQAYEWNRELTNESAIQSCAIAGPLGELMGDSEHWTGTASELLEELSHRVDERTAKQRGWPKQPNTLSGQLRRIAPNLRRMGWEIDLDGRHAKTRAKIIAISTIPEKTVQIIRTVQTPVFQGPNANDGQEVDRSGERCERSPERSPEIDRSQENPIKQGSNVCANDPNGPNDEIPACSNNDDSWEV